VALAESATDLQRETHCALQELVDESRLPKARRRTDTYAAHRTSDGFPEYAVQQIQLVGATNEWRGLSRHSRLIPCLHLLAAFQDLEHRERIHGLAAALDLHVAVSSHREELPLAAQRPSGSEDFAFAGVIGKPSRERHDRTDQAVVARAD